MYDTQTIANAVKSVIENINNDGQIKIGVSQRHIHLSQDHGLWLSYGPDIS